MRLFFVLLLALVSAPGTPERPAVFTATQAASGKIEIQKNLFGACTDCHATSLTGRTGKPGELPPLASLSDDYQTLINNNAGVVPALVGPEFRAKWTSRSTKDLIDEFEMRFAPPGSRMSLETRLNLIAFLLQANGGKPGAQPLTLSTIAPLAQILQN